MLARLFIFLVILNYLCVALGLQCFECTDIGLPFQCDFVTTCSQGSKCFVDQKITSGGLILYDSGCRSSQVCRSSKRQIVQQDHTTDIIMCEECCDGEFCNRQGCNVQDLDRSVRGPYCFSCHSQGGENKCRHVTQCGIGEVCSIKDISVNTISQYRTECVQPKNCFHNVSARDTRATTTLIDRCPKCCDQDFCNNDCTQNLTVVDGGYSAWSLWSDCSVTCGSGYKHRSRTCTNPAPANGGEDCIGSARERHHCFRKHCPRNGGFSQWSAWSTCSVTCGRGQQQRSRTCSHPAPAYGGADCTGPTTANKQCGMWHCPVDGGFTQWSEWTDCTVTCGGGRQQRSRSCTNPAPAYGGADCNGAIRDGRQCGTGHCPDGCSGYAFQYFPSVHMCLRLMPHAMTRDKARNECLQLHGDLVVIDSTRKDQVVQQLIENSQLRDKGAWIGLHVNALNWQWQGTGQVLSPQTMYSNFFHPAALTINTHEHCVAIEYVNNRHHQQYGWVVAKCSETHIAVCEKFR